MYNQNTTLKSQTVIQDLEVIGRGGMIDIPCQIGDWWVMPANQYTGKIPDEVQAKWDRFKALNIPVLGYLIADDMRDVIIRREKEAEQKRELEQQALERERLEIARLQAVERERREVEWRQRKQAAAQAAQEAAMVTGQVLGGIAKAVGVVALGAVALTAGVLLAILRFDPVIIAVVPPDEDYPGGRWIAVASWWD